MLDSFFCEKKHLTSTRAKLFDLNALQAFLCAELIFLEIFFKNSMNPLQARLESSEKTHGILLPMIERIFHGCDG